MNSDTWSIRGLVALLFAVLLLAACNENEGQDKTVTAAGGPASGQSADPVDSSEQSAAAQSAGEESQQVESAESAAQDPKPTADILDRHWQETTIEFKNPISMNMELRSAVFNPADGADMSILTFEASSRIDRHDWLYQDVVMDSLKSEGSAILELDICSVEMMPLLKNPVATGRTSTGSTTLQMNGGLKFVVRDPDGNLMGTFLVDEDGMLYEAETGELYSWRIAETTDDMRPAEYVFYRTPGRGESIHYEFGIAYKHGTKARQLVTDPLGHEITYLFPNGSVEILPPHPPVRRDPDEFRRN